MSKISSYNPQARKESYARSVIRKYDADQSSVSLKRFNRALGVLKIQAGDAHYNRIVSRATAAKPAKLMIPMGGVVSCGC